ncbi:transcription factor E2F/dimerization partner, partial [Opisthorchis viverrini]
MFIHVLKVTTPRSKESNKQPPSPPGHDSGNEQEQMSTGFKTNGLRRYARCVCNKVKEKGVTSYIEVADELVHEYAAEHPMIPSEQLHYIQKNIRRRVYDALNVLMALDRKTVIDCNIPTDKLKYLFNFDQAFEIRDEVDTLKRTGLMLRLGSIHCTQEEYNQCLELVPPSLWFYVEAIYERRQAIAPDFEALHQQRRLFVEVRLAAAEANSSSGQHAEHDDEMVEFLALRILYSLKEDNQVPPFLPWINPVPSELYHA